jgi:hypothetical protein
MDFRIGVATSGTELMRRSASLARIAYTLTHEESFCRIDSPAGSDREGENPRLCRRHGNAGGGGLCQPEHQQGRGQPEAAGASLAGWFRNEPTAAAVANGALPEPVPVSRERVAGRLSAR